MNKGSFPSLGVDPRLSALLASLNIRNPTHIQWKALPSQLSSQDHHFMAAQTGTGKTLAYLIPALQRWVKRGQQQEGGNLVVTCNRELVVQLEHVLAPFKYSLGFTSAALYGGQDPAATQEALKSSPYFLCGTLDKVLSLKAKGELNLEGMKQVIVDECDTLIDSGKSASISDLLAFSLPLKQRFTLVSATFPRRLETLLERYFTAHPGTVIDKPYLRRVVDQRTHLNLEHIKHEFVPVKDKKEEKLLLSLLADISPKLQTHHTCILFCNTTQSVDSILSMLLKHGFSAVGVHSLTPAAERLAAYEQFRKGEKRFLVCTDMGARGLDFPDTTYVIQVEFAKTASDYLHRAGRTGRCYKEGTVISFYRPSDERLIAHLKSSFEARTPLNLPSPALS